MNSIERLIRDMRDLKQEVRSRQTPQAKYSSMDDGTWTVTAGGETVLEIGAQSDGTNTVRHVTGPTPPAPSRPVAAVDGPVITISWDGLTADGADLPADYRRIRVYAWQDTPTPVSAISPATGGTTVYAAPAEGIWNVALAMESQSGQISDLSDIVQVEVDLVDLSGAIEAVAVSANGKNNVLYGTGGPPTPYGGVVGDTYFQNEALLGENGDPTTQVVITAQYTWDGTAWQQVQLSHETLASVDLGTATVGYLNGQRIVAGSIDADLFIGDIFTGYRFTGAEFVAGNTILSESLGLQQTDADGNVRVSIPGDGSAAQFRGDVEADSLQVQDMTLTDSGSVESGAVLTVQGGISKPGTTPTATLYYDTIPLPPTTGTVRAFCVSDTTFYRLVYQDSAMVLQSFTTAGVLETSVTLDNVGTDYASRGVWGVTVLGSSVYTIASIKSDKRSVVHGHSMAGAYQRSWVYPNIGTATYLPGIGNNGTGLLIAHANQEGVMIYRTFSTTGTLQIAQTTTDGFAADCSGVALVTGDMGASRVVAQKAATGYFTPYSGTSYDSSRAWHSRTRSKSLGMGYDGTSWYSLDADGFTVTKYGSFSTDSTAAVGDNTNQWWVAYSWTDGTAETVISPPVQVTWNRRGSLQVDVQGTPPTGVNGAYVYLFHGSQVLGTSIFRRVGMISWAGTVKSVCTVPAVVTGYSTMPQNPTQSTFGPGSYGQIQDGAGKWLLRGDGTVKLPGVAYAMSGGSRTFSQTNAGTGTTATIQLPPGRFTQPPLLFTGSQNARINTSGSIGNLTSFTLDVRNWTSSNAAAFTAYWFAVQMTPESAGE